MCGRFTLRTNPSLWTQQFLPEIINQLPEFRPRYNIAPTQSVATILHHPDQESILLEPLRWGLLPVWADQLSVGARMINARSETVAEKPAFRSAFRKRRCLIPADGYYEWRNEQGRKQPYFFCRPEQQLFAFAGLWEINKKLGTPDQPQVTCTLLTTTANSRIASYHDRMPVVIEPPYWHEWLSLETSSLSLQSMFAPKEIPDLQIAPVDSYVNNAKHESAECLKFIE